MKPVLRTRFFHACVSCILLAAGPLCVRADVHGKAVDGLLVTSPTDPPSGPTVLIEQPLGSKGPTSIRYLPPSDARNPKPSANPADPKGSRFLAKDRDLGQTFTVPAGPARRLRAVTLRVGAAPYQGSIDGARGASMVLQILTVSGAPVIHDNGTTGITTVSVSYPDQSLADDYITGETYTHVGAARGGLLPQTMRISAKNTVFPTPESKGTLLRFQLPESLMIVLKPTGCYAFLVGFESPAPGRSLPLDNWDFLNQKTATDAQRKQGPYSGGHAIRREGRIEHPHLRLREVLELDASDDSPDPTASTFLPLLEDRLDQEPGTWGRPDVDTYRDLVFWLEAEPILDPKAADSD